MTGKECCSDDNNCKCACCDSGNLVVVGCQWGDEGKGKIVDFLASDYDIVVRYNGGNNAGHTVVIGDEKYKFHLIPSGSIQKKKVVMGNGMAVDPKVLISEIKTLKEKNLDPKLFLSDRAHVIMPYHRMLDASREKKRCGGKLGTTGRGIGPAYVDKVGRTESIRMCDLVNGSLKDRIKGIIELKKDYLVCIGAIKPEEIESYVNDIVKEYEGYAKILRPYICDTSIMINEEIKKGSSILFEGAQGMMLDVDHGTYPFVTSSSVTSGGVCAGAGVGPKVIGKVVGIAKAYTTRVGGGPFPTELHDKKGDELRERGAEFGTTTGRPRRCGWLDLVVLRHAATINGLDGIVLTKMDVLSGTGKVKVCTAYKIDGKTVNNMPASIKDMENAEPVYEELPGWDEFDGTEKKCIPENAIKFIERIEKETGVPVIIVSNGQRRDQTIVF